MILFVIFVLVFMVIGDLIGFGLATKGKSEREYMHPASPFADHPLGWSMVGMFVGGLVAVLIAWVSGWLGHI